MPTLQIDVFADVVCPWCFIGAARLDEALKQLPPGVTVERRHHAFLLSPDTPAGGMDLRAELKRKYGRDPEPMFANVEKVAREAGVPMDFKKQPMTWPTLDAHTLLRHAEPLGTQQALGRALYAAYFQDGRNISDAAVLLELATAHGFAEADARALLASAEERNLTRAEAHEASRMGIRGVPFFIFNEELALSGAQPVEVFVAAMQRALG